MIKKKICLLGAFAVGKTSLINQFVNESFSYKYETTIGVKIDKKVITINNNNLEFIIWDIHGHDKFQSVRKSYLLGCSGYFLVVDATRKDSIESIPQLMELVNKSISEVPFYVLVNKSDLESLHEIEIQDLIEIGIKQENILWTSAKTGDGVEDAFLYLGLKMIHEN